MKPAAKRSEFVLEQCRLDLPLNVVVFMQSAVAALGEQVSALSSFNQMADDNKELLLMTTKDTTMIADAYLQRLSQPPKAASAVCRNSGSTTKNTMHVVSKAEQRRLASRITIYRHEAAIAPYCMKSEREAIFLFPFRRSFP